jgi:hypothetical protein
LTVATHTLSFFAILVCFAPLARKRIISALKLSRFEVLDALTRPCNSDFSLSVNLNTSTGLAILYFLLPLKLKHGQYSAKYYYFYLFAIQHTSMLGLSPTILNFKIVGLKTALLKNETSVIPQDDGLMDLWITG